MKLEDRRRNDVRQYQWRYWPVAECCQSSELGNYATYGILAASAVPDGWKVVKELHDVALDGDAVREMAALFTRCQLSPLHLLEAVEDRLSLKG